MTSTHQEVTDDADRRSSTTSRSLAAQIIVERAERGVDTVDDEILAIANAKRIPGTDTLRGVFEDQPA